MSSSFSSLRKKHPLIKTVASIQEWCGQSYLQLNHKKQDYTLISHSYFEGEADQELTIPKIAFSEDEIWNLIRLNPNKLPTGEFDFIPALENIRLNHMDVKVLKAIGTKKEGEYKLYLPDIERSLTIWFSNEFPFIIEGWEEKYDRKRGFLYLNSTTHSHRTPSILARE